MTQSHTMKAIVQDEYGSADVLHIAEIDRPVIGEDDVLVRVHAAGLDRGTWHLMAGLPYLIRVGFGFRGPKNPVPGLDVAGTVVAVGENVTRFQAGDEVFGTAKGSFAEYASALQELAKAFGAEVTGVASTAKVDLVRSIGADHVIDYTQEDFADGSQHYDLILDVGGNSPLSKLRAALTQSGTLVIVGGEEGGRWFGGINRQLRAMALSPFIGQRLTTFISKENHADLERLTEIIEAGDLTPVIDRTYPLGQAPQAMRHLQAGQARGKIVITVRSPE